MKILRVLLSNFWKKSEILTAVCLETTGSHHSLLILWGKRGREGGRGGEGEESEAEGERERDREGGRRQNGEVKSENVCLRRGFLPRTKAFVHAAPSVWNNLLSIKFSLNSFQNSLSKFS